MRLLPELFARQAALTPDAVAVADDHQELSYAALDRDSGRVASALLAGGYTTGKTVGVRMSRGVDLAVAVWGILKAGATYVALDRNHPAQRIARVMAETGCELVLTEELVRSFVATHDSVPGVDVHPDSPACVMYTSGSTGQPKGAVNTHANLANRVVTTVSGRELGPGDRWLQKSALSFDASITELFSPVICGATVVMAPDGAERDAKMMLQAVIRHRATVLQVVPPVLRLVAAEPLLRECTSLRLLTTGGGLLHAELCHQVWRQLPDITIWNTYGPTECTVEQTEYRCDPAQLEGPVVIGRPIPGCQVLVLDEDCGLLPVGVPGEVCVGGVQVGLGYAGRPDLTAEKFLPDPFGPPGSRLYRTGDVARWREDGLLEWLGRIDFQVKVNGVRIEPVEIETALLECPGVTGCAVLAVPDGHDKRLVAYVTGPGDLRPASLRSALREKLPDHLIPAAFVELAQLPLNTSGKVDRDALRALDLTEHTSGAAHVPVESDLERAVADVWSELLQRRGIGAEDDFFQLGGHSLLITRLAERLRAASGRQVEIRELFAATTVRAQAALLSTSDSTAGEHPLAELPTPTRIPLSSGQQRLWFLEKLGGNSLEYLVPVFLRVAASTTTEAVHRVLDELAARHDILRTRYETHDGEPHAVVDPPSPVELCVRQLPVDTDACHEIFRREFARGFDLEHGPVWRGLLLRDAAGNGRLMLTLHHIACDAQSIAVLTDEFARLCAGESLPPVALTYADHAVRQRASMSEDFLAGQLAFWRTEVDGLPPLELPTDRPRGPERDATGGALDFRLPPAQAEALIEVGRRHGATPYMTLLTVFDVLLGRYSGEWDFAVGTPVAGRTQPGTENVVGFFLNSLTLRNRVRPEHTFATALTGTRTACTAAFGHAELPFERLVEDVLTERDLARTPLFQVIFDLHEGDAAAANSTDEDSAALGAIWRSAKADLALIVRRHADGSLQGILHYATALFDEGTVARLGANFVRLAQELPAAPDVPVGMAEMVAETEHDLLVHRFNDTRRPPPQVPVHLTIAERACEHPDVPALITNGDVTTCAQLDAHANRIARVLRDRGAGQESVVGVLLDRGPGLVATLLGIWKAGAAYVPLDPAFPAERVSYVLADSNAVLLVTDSELEELATGFDGPRLLLDSNSDEIAAAGDGVFPAEGELDALAYVIYTSGSTGRPKGVAVSHRNLANYLMWTVGAYAAYGTGGAPVFTSIAFDLGIPNLFTPLLTGQPAHLFSHDLDLAKLGPALVDAGPFAFIKLAPAQLELVLHQLAGRAPARLAGLVSAAGDRVPAVLAEQWRAVNGDGTRFVAEYGPTEITVGNSLFAAEEPWHKEFLSIGRPIPNTTMYVLDGYLRPVPIGVTGEVYVGGAGVSRGYTGKPALTAEKFLPDPFGLPGGRLYRTGDLGRMTESGAVEFRGRTDDQVKIRGYRVELGEVEAVLLAHPGVREAVLVLDGDSGARQRLVAYCVGDGDTDGLRKFLSARMPAYQVPDVVVWLDSLPLTTNGKVDRRALPAPDGVARPAPVGQEPRTELEQRVASVWMRVLPGEVGTHDNFFACGGHSLTAVKLVSMLRDEFGLEISVRALFDQPTVSGLAGVIAEMTGSETPLGAIEG